MKKIILVFLMSLSIFSFAQDNFSIHFSQTYSRFRFRDSNGDIDENLKSDIRYSYAMNYQKTFPSGVFIRPEFGYKNWGATSVIDGSKINWSLHYLDLDFAGGYIFNEWKFKPYVGTALYFSYLFKGEQTIGNQYFDLIELEAIKKIDIGINVFSGVKYTFSELASVFFEFRNSTGFRQLEINSEVGQSQKLYNRAISFHFGLVFSLKPDIVNSF